MKLNEIAENRYQRMIASYAAETARQKAAYTKSAQAWFKLQKAQAEEQKARKLFIQAALEFSRSYQHRSLL
jgi:lipopolysaccharide biosynthesis regulator YciM